MIRLEPFKHNMICEVNMNMVCEWWRLDLMYAYSAIEYLAFLKIGWGGWPWKQ